MLKIFLRVESFLKDFPFFKKWKWNKTFILYHCIKQCEM
jgi:hypothetical protein